MVLFVYLSSEICGNLHAQEYMSEEQTALNNAYFGSSADFQAVEVFALNVLKVHEQNYFHRFD